MGRQFFFNRWHNLWRAFFWAIGSVLGLVSVISATLAISLSAGPIPLDFAIPYLDNLLSSKDVSYHVHMEKAYLIWDKDQSCLAVQAENIHLQHPSIDHHCVRVPSLELKFKPMSLLKLKVIPFEVELNEPHIHLYRTKDGEYSMTKSDDATESSQDLKHLLQDFTISGLRTLRNVRISNLHIDVVDLNGSTWDVPRLDLHLIRQDHVINCELSAYTRGAKAGGNATLSLNKTDRKLQSVDIKVKGFLNDFTFDDLDKFWHTLLAPTPRNWIMENLSGARVQTADLNANWKLEFGSESPLLTLLEMGGDIHFTGMKVLYFGDLPPVKDVDGHATYNNKVFDIKVHKGKLEDMTVTGGRVYIQDLDQDDQYITIDVNIEGPMKTALEILDRKPINLSQKIGLKPHKIQGPAEGVIHFDFPLETKITMDDVNFKAQAKLKNATMIKPLGDKTSTDLKHGNFCLCVDRSKLKVEGSGYYGSLKADVVWEQKFEDNPKDWKIRYDVQTTLLPHNMVQLGYAGYTDGPIMMKAQLIEQEDKSQKLIVNTDLTQTRILLPLFDTAHVAGQKMTAQVHASLKDGVLNKINKMEIIGKNIHLNPSLNIDPKKSLITNLDCLNAKIGPNNFNFKMHLDDQSHYRLKLEGKSLDLEALVEYLKNTETSEEPITPFHFSCSIQQALFHKGQKSLHNLTCKGFHDKSSLRTLEAHGQLLDSLNHHRGDLKVHQYDSDEKQKKLFISSDNAGDTLDLLGLTSAVNGGVLKLEMTQQENQNWHGKLKLHDFHLREAPVVTRILSVISPFGIIEAVAGRPLSFAKFSAKLISEKDRLLIKQGRAMGPSIGLNVNGIVDHKNNTLDLHGTILPYNAINVFLAKVPLVGQLLGGKGGGIFGFQYTISGSIDDPSTSVNPLSVLTPGILRNVFAHPDPEESDPESSEE